MGALAYQLYRLGRRISRTQIVAGLFPRGVRSMIQARLLPSAINLLPDRRYMEEVLLPAIDELQPIRLVDVGVQHYSSHYRRSMGAGCEYWTLDLNPAAAEFGAPGRHIVGNVLDLADHFAPRSLDVVLLNGAFGFGIDRREEQERAVEAARTVLRPNGWLLIGWDRGGDGRPLVFGDDPVQGGLDDPLHLAAIRTAFVHRGPPGLPARVDFAESAHVYDWFQRGP